MSEFSNPSLALLALPPCQAGLSKFEFDYHSSALMTLFTVNNRAFFSVGSLFVGSRHRQSEDNSWWFVSVLQQGLPCFLWYSMPRPCICHEYSQVTTMRLEASIFSLSAREHLYSPVDSLLTAVKVKLSEFFTSIFWPWRR